MTAEADCPSHGWSTPIAAQLGSRREATWIVDHAGPGQAQALADRRRAGEPLQYVLGSWPFRTVELQVDPRVLIPRPETEQVVGVALEELARICGGPGAGSGSAGPAGHRICVDLGTGSGAIALSLAAEGRATCPDLEVWATDVSTDALAVAGANLAVTRTGRSRRRPAGCGWPTARGSTPCPPRLAGRVDLLVSNPPYVTESEYPGLDPSVREWEPRGALVAARDARGVEGMADLEAIISDAPRWLRPTGMLVVEIAPSLAGASEAAARRAGFARVAIGRDLAGRLRTLVAGW